MPDTFKWKCPACPDSSNTIEALSEAALELKTLNHIRRHENAAALRAVDRARIDCRNAACELGKNRVYNLKLGIWEYDITEYDRRILRGINVKWEGDDRNERKMLPPGEEKK